MRKLRDWIDGMTTDQAAIAVAVVFCALILAAGLAGGAMLDREAAKCEARPGYVYISARTGNRCVRVVE